MSHSFWKGKCNEVFSVHSSKTLLFWWIILWSCFEKYNKIWDFYFRIHWVSFPPNHGLFWNSLHTPIYSINIYIYLCVNTCVYMYIHIYVWACSHYYLEKTNKQLNWITDGLFFFLQGCEDWSRRIYRPPAIRTEIISPAISCTFP